MVVVFRVSVEVYRGNEEQVYFYVEICKGQVVYEKAWDSQFVVVGQEDDQDKDIVQKSQQINKLYYNFQEFVIYYVFIGIEFI